MEKTAAAACGGGEDFFIQILVRLPVTSLLRFKSVCKSWRALIQTSYFIHLHTTTTTTTSNSSSKFGTFILQALQYQHGNYSMKNAILMLSSESGSGSGSGSEYGDWYWGTDGSWHKFSGGGGGGDWHWDDINCGWYWVSDDYDQEGFKVNDDDDDDDQLVLKLQNNFGLPSCYKLCSGEVMAGSCNGLICLHDSYPRTVSLWNPATRQFRRLPKSITGSIEKKIGDFDFVGFGFDVKTKDYKVVQISCFRPTTLYIAQWQPGCICRAEVYSLSTDSWRLLEGINLLPGLPMDGHHGINLLPDLPMDGHHGLYLNGSYFFVGTKITSELPRDNRFLMFSFDFTKEIFTTMQFPDHDNRQNLVLSCLGEKLALFITGGDQSPSSSSYEDYDIWVWNEHGACSSVNKESWTKLHSFPIKNRGGGAFERTIPRGISNNGEFALIETSCNSQFTRWNSELKKKKKKKKMQLFNLVTKEAKKDFLICDSVCRTDVYQQSLVSIIGGNDASTSSRSR